MSGRSFSTEVLVSAKPKSVYGAITEGIDKWWTELSNRAVKAGDKLVVRFEKSTSWEMTLTEAVPNRSIVWRVDEGHHDLEGITRTDEWKGTAIIWKITENGAGSKIALTHEGLVPALECYEICGAGWDHFLRSLTSYLESGSGYPYRRSLSG